jgi:hypothetical protein
MYEHSPIVYDRDIRLSPHNPAAICATSTWAMGAAGAIWRETPMSACCQGGWHCREPTQAAR